MPVLNYSDDNLTLAESIVRLRQYVGGLSQRKLQQAIAPIWANSFTVGHSLLPLTNRWIANAPNQQAIATTERRCGCYPSP